MKSTEPGLESPDILEALLNPAPDQPKPDPREDTEIIDLRMGIWRPEWVGKIDDCPHPPGATYAMRYSCTDDTREAATAQAVGDAEEHEPPLVSYEIRHGGYWVEWYSYDTLPSHER